MIDAFELMRTSITSDQTSERVGLTANRYGVVTLHRPSNVDRSETLAILVDQLVQASTRLPLVFAVHPRTRRRLIEDGDADLICSVVLLDPDGRRIRPHTAPRLPPAFLAMLGGLATGALRQLPLWPVTVVIVVGWGRGRWVGALFR